MSLAERLSPQNFIFALENIHFFSDADIISQIPAAQRDLFTKYIKLGPNPSLFIFPAINSHISFIEIKSLYITVRTNLA